MSIENSKFVAKKQFPNGVRAIVTGACKRPASVQSLAGALSKQRGKRYTTQKVGNLLRWLQRQGYVTRHGESVHRPTRKAPASNKKAGKNKKRTVH
jgi:hypothetical protein